MWYEIVIKIFLTAFFFWLLAWTLFAWGFGMTNFKLAHSKFLGMVGEGLWGLLIIGHVIAIILLWSTAISALSLIGSLLLGHVFYGVTFARNVSTR